MSWPAVFTVFSQEIKILSCHWVHIFKNLGPTFTLTVKVASPAIFTCMFWMLTPHAETIHVTAWMTIIQITAIYFSLEGCNSCIVQWCLVHSYVTFLHVCIFDYNPAIFKKVGCPALDGTPTARWCHKFIEFTFNIAHAVNTAFISGLSEYLLIKIFDVNSRAGCKE